MIRIEERVIDILSKAYYREHDGLTLYSWLQEKGKELGIKRIHRYDYFLVFESPEDEIVFRLKFGI